GHARSAAPQAHRRDRPDPRGHGGLARQRGAPAAQAAAGDDPTHERGQVTRMSDDLDELDAALRRAMAALDGDAPAGYFEALPGRTLARLDDPEIHELPEQ